jgi:hypothetical protein
VNEETLSRKKFSDMKADSRQVWVTYATDITHSTEQCIS